MEAATYISGTAASYLYPTDAGPNAELVYHRAKVHNVDISNTTSRFISGKGTLNSHL